VDLQVFHQAERDVLGEHPRSVEQGKVDGLPDGGQGAGDGFRRDFPGEDDPVGSQSYQGEDGLRQDGNVVFAEGNENSHERLLVPSTGDHGAAEQLNTGPGLLEASRHPAYPVMESRLPSEELDLKMLAAGAEKVMQEARVGERSAVGAKTNAGKPEFPSGLDQLDNVAPDERLAARQQNALPRLGEGAHGGDELGFASPGDTARSGGALLALEVTPGSDKDLMKGNHNIDRQLGAGRHGQR